MFLMRSQFVPPPPAPPQSSQFVPQDVPNSASLYPYITFDHNHIHITKLELESFMIVHSTKNMGKLFRDFLNQLVSDIL